MSDLDGKGRRLALSGDCTKSDRIRVRPLLCSLGATPQVNHKPMTAIGIGILMQCTDRGRCLLVRKSVLRLQRCR